MKLVGRLATAKVWQRVLVLLLAVSLVLVWAQKLEARTPDGPVQPSSAGASALAQAEGFVRPPAAAEPAPGASSFTGDVRSKDKVVIASKAPMRIKQIRVDVGDFVKKGELIAELDHDLLDAQVKQGEAVLTLADAQLAKLRSGSRIEQIAIGEANVAVAQAQLDLLLEGARKEQIASAQSNLKSSQAKLDLTLAGPTQEQLTIAELQARIADAQDTLRARTQDASGSINARGLQPYNSEMAFFQEIVGQLQVQLAQAQLTSVKAPPRTQQVAQLQADVDGFRAQLELLTSPPRPQQVAQLKAAVEVAKQQLELTKNPNTDNDLAAAVAGVVQAQAAFQIIKSNRDDAFLTAPFDGIIAARSASPGALVMAGEAIVTLISAESEALFMVGEAELAQVKSGQPVSVTVPAYPGQTFKGTVRAISPQADPTTRRFSIYVSLADQDGKLKPGMFATVGL